MLHDQNERKLATNPQQSFIIQAPAGSGKTEILIQRYLRLLSNVQNPEQIVAITFTRKAANEMRERILESLQKALDNIEPTSSHQAETYAYAKAALSRNNALNWQLLDHPSRMRVFTIDSLCQQLNQSIPLKPIAYNNISNNALRLYRKASENCLLYAIKTPDYQNPIKTLLTHLDNNQELLLTLLTNLLGKRDQWLEPLHTAKLQDKEILEQALFNIEQHEIKRFIATIPFHLKDELINLSQSVAITINNPALPIDKLKNWTEIEELDALLCRSLAALLLTTQNTLRKAFDQHVGFKKDICDAQYYKITKSRSQELLKQLDATPDFLDNLLRVQKLPSPDYDNAQWDVLQSLFTLLPLLVAHLHLIFSEQNEIDFTAIASQAIDALGTDEIPTDLALYLDHQIHHLLIDEFQDTSLTQFELLKKLTQEWQPDCGKTIFIVGDPMQSIYRFRAAEVGLFLKVQQEGIGAIHLTNLKLSCNFRSNAKIIEWINHHFQYIFPQKDDIESGAISFHKSQAIKNEEDSFISAITSENKEFEAEKLVNLVTELLNKYPKETIAILVRSRTQLVHIMSLLRQYNIAFQGVDIDALSKLPHIQDVWSLTQILLMPGERTPWLAFLHSPLCGINLSDIHKIANFDKSIYKALANVEKIQDLTIDSKKRVEFIVKILTEAFVTRYQQSLTQWINVTLKSLNIDKIFTKSQFEDLEQYWKLLDQYEIEGKLTDFAQFKVELARLYSKTSSPSRLNIMTIHKSKGLEFDFVILPGLSQKSPKPNQELIRWLKLPTTHEEILLFSPIKAQHQDECLLYNYLAKLDAEKDRYELQRLLYVAVTRAKKHLYLFDFQESKSSTNFRNLLKKQEFNSEVQAEKDKILTEKLPILYHLPQEYFNCLHLKPNEKEENYVTIATEYNLTRILGIITHELLQWICNTHPESSNDIPWSFVQNRLIAAGCLDNNLKSALTHIQEQIKRLFDCSHGRWIIQRHQDEHNEFEILTKHENKIVTRIIDRTFVYQDIHFIVDFKTGFDNKKQHRTQVNEYAELFSQQYQKPVHCGLYYLLNNHWETWEFTGSARQNSKETLSFEPT